MKIDRKRKRKKIDRKRKGEREGKLIEKSERRKERKRQICMLRLTPDG